MKKKNKIIITLHLIYAALSSFLLFVLLDLSTAYAPVAINIERSYYLSTLSELYGLENMAESVSNNSEEVHEKGSFYVAEKLWKLNNNSDLEVIHQRLLQERNEGLEKAPSVETEVKTEAVKVWLIMSIIIYGLFILIWIVSVNIIRRNSIKKRQSKETEQSGNTTGSYSNRSNAGWNGKM